MTPEEQKELHKEAIKEAISEWLDKQILLVGRWTLKGLASMALVGMFWLYASAHGWNIKF